MIKVRLINSVETYPIRKEVLRSNIPLPYIFEGDDSAETIHVGAFYNEKIIAVSSFMKAKNEQFEGSQYQLRGMATLKEFQKNGAGKLMLEFAIEEMKQLKVNLIWCNARVKAIPFYEKQGFKTVGNEFDINYVGGHFVMVKYISYAI